MKFKLSIKPLLALVLSIAFLSCSKKVTTQGNNQKELLNAPKFVESKVLIYQDGMYLDLDTEMKPKPTQGEDEFYRDMYLNLRYPANARENNIQGTVIFEVDIDEDGNVEQINRTSSLSKECDKEAQSAIERGCSKGFQPYEFNGKIVKVRYLIPVNFRLR